MQTDLAIMLNHDGDNYSGFYQIYPANEESEPEGDFKNEFVYGPEADYKTRTDAKQAAENEASRLACRIGGDWFTNER